jgi:hypothetical protein
MMRAQDGKVDLVHLVLSSRGLIKSRDATSAQIGTHYVVGHYRPVRE